MTEDRENKGTFAFPPGHFYSPVPSIREIKLREEYIFDQWPETLPGIDLHVPGQLALLDAFRKFYPEFPFGAERKEGLRFFRNNPSYGHSDALILYCMLRFLKPKRIIEIGSGFSSCLTLDVNELFMENRMECTFIEPYPELLRSLLRDTDTPNIEIIPGRLQEVDTELFSALSPSDILFIDSTHVAKVDSDVNHIFFRILPGLRPGVSIHFHDIFYPFEYPKNWFYEGLAWNEAYILRAFLQHNPSYRIAFFNTYLAYFHPEKFFRDIPFPLDYVGGSLWIEKVQGSE
ncbi:MAG: class I SAM-dependent methyltransferase [Nitrospirota bacterium]